MATVVAALSGFALSPLPLAVAGKGGLVDAREEAVAFLLEGVASEGLHQKGPMSRLSGVVLEHEVREMSLAQGTTIDAIRQKYENQLMSLPNVTGVGIGEKNGKPVIKVFVTRRIPESSLRPDEMIPGVLEGYETDIEEVGDLTAQPRVPTAP